ncbi:hypothetical protein GJ744_010644 [Endocarpon pusillum]|uniref:Uncharacterized protein n=1 Tax=Endocarpon pusillum TaxID=364733 RepID=A0A8H7AQ42_9EURO|nr:hypothetical protein GJ744_010644 [Endocarpon pusillum]
MQQWSYGFGTPACFRTVPFLRLHFEGTILWVLSDPKDNKILPFLQQNQAGMIAGGLIYRFDCIISRAGRDRDLFGPLVAVKN